MELRPYQEEALDDLLTWWNGHKQFDHDAPVLVLPTGGGKAILCAALVHKMFDTFPHEHPRTLVLVPSKELAEQNAEKLRAVVQPHLTIGYYSAALGRKRPDADVIVATIGSVYQAAHLLGDIKMVIVDECHMVSPDGAGRYRQLLRDLAKYCSFRVVGLTATPFRGNGVWITDGEDPFFTGIIDKIGILKLIELGFLAPLVRPVDAIQTRIDTSTIEIASTGDYKIDQLSDCVSEYITGIAEETVRLAAERRKWIAFCATVANATLLRDTLRGLGITAEVVVGDTPKAERERLIKQFKAGEIRCLISVIALTTGFDVPDVDCVIWCRPTRSPVLYVQGSGRGLRISPGKTDCLWLDFSDTTDRLGAIDAIKGRKKIKRSAEDREAPHATCPECGCLVRPASLMYCPECNALMREIVDERRAASNAAVLSTQALPAIVRKEVNRVTYAKHSKPDKPDSLKVEYWDGLTHIATEWICLEHTGWAKEKAASWWTYRMPSDCQLPPNVDTAVSWIKMGYPLAQPCAVIVNKKAASGFPEILDYEWPQSATDSTEAGHAGARVEVLERHPIGLHDLPAF
jgi:DNA repair protein RadD